MRKTTNYGLALYDLEDKMTITASENSLNNNMELIDSALKEKATIEDMTVYIEEHKDELKGADGTNGTDGINGKDGENGTDGYSPTAKVETTSIGATITITDKNGTTTTTITNGKDGVDGEQGLQGEQGIQGEQGPKGDTGETGPQGPQGEKGDKGDKGDTGEQGSTGKDGVSVTHSWNGTTLTITSASGTSSANLKGEKGDKGEQGIQGIQGEKGATGSKGADGYTPVKGTDYWTDEDKTEIKEYVKDEIPTKTSQLTNDSGFLTEVELTQEQLDEIADAVVEAQKMEFVDSTDGCTDTSKQYVLPDGYIYAYMQKTIDVLHNANNGTCLLNTSHTANASMNTTRARSGTFFTQPIEVDKNWADCIVNISGIEKLVENYFSTFYAVYYDDNGDWIGYFGASGFGLSDSEVTLPITINLARTSSATGASYWSNTKYVRMMFSIKEANQTITNDDVKDLVINFERLNTTENVYGWYSTGHMYNKDEYSQAIEQNASNIETLQTDVNTLKEAVKTTPSQSGAVWYAVGDSITKGYGVGADKCWVKYVLDYNGYDKEKSLNLGISGLGFAKSDPNYSKTARIVVDENDFTNVDLVTVAIGINDWKEPFSIDTVKSEMRYCFEKILTDNPYCKIFFIVPFNTCMKGSASTNWALGYSGSDVTGGTLQNFIDAQKSICEEYGIQIIDMTNNSVINKSNIETVLYDKIHPDAKCHIALGRELARRITYA